LLNSSEKSDETSSSRTTDLVSETAGTGVGRTKAFDAFFSTAAGFIDWDDATSSTLTAASGVDDDLFL
jgi:hypothetical protein